MSRTDRRTEFMVLLGFGLLALGLWILFSPILWPLQWIFTWIARIGWPLVLIAIGVLLIMRARGAGWNTAGRTFYRSRTDRMIGGAIGGFGQYVGVDPTVLRLVYAIATLFTGIWLGLVVYLLAMLIVPEEPLPAGYTPPPAPSVPGPPPAAPTPPTPPAPTPPAPPAPPAPAPEPSADSTAPPEAPPVPPEPPVL